MAYNDSDTHADLEDNAVPCPWCGKSLGEPFSLTPMFESLQRFNCINCDRPVTLRCETHVSYTAQRGTKLAATEGSNDGDA